MYLKRTHGTYLVGEDDLDMARAGHVRVDATVSTVSATAAVLGLVDLNVMNVEIFGVERLHLSIALRIGEKILQVPDGLLRKATGTVVIVILAQV